MRRWIRWSVAAPSLLIAAGIAGFAFELARPTDPGHASAAFGVIGVMLTLGGTLLAQVSQAEEDHRRRREDLRWRREHLARLASLRHAASTEEAELLGEEVAADDDD
jgi:hypothetical protein